MLKCVNCLYYSVDFDTDEETDQLLEKQYQGNQYMDIPELSQPPVNRSAQVTVISLCENAFISPHTK